MTEKLKSKTVTIHLNEHDLKSLNLVKKMSHYEGNWAKLVYDLAMEQSQKVICGVFIDYCSQDYKMTDFNQSFQDETAFLVDRIKELQVAPDIHDTERSIKMLHWTVQDYRKKWWSDQRKRRPIFYKVIVPLRLLGEEKVPKYYQKVGVL